MYVFQISCLSKCGTYFMPYLKSITVIAENEEQAKIEAKKWMEKEGYEFIYPEEKWDVEKIAEVKIGVIDYINDTDY